MKDAKTALGQRSNPSKQRPLRVFLFNFGPFFLLFFVSSWFYFVDFNLVSALSESHLIDLGEGGDA